MLLSVSIKHMKQPIYYLPFFSLSHSYTDPQACCFSPQMFQRMNEKTSLTLHILDIHETS